MKLVRLSALALSGALALSLLTACGGTESPVVSDSPLVSAPSAGTASALPSPGAGETPAASDSPAAADRPAVTETPAATQPPAASPNPAETPASPSTQSPSATPAPAVPSDSGAAQAASAAELWDQITAGLALPALMDLDDETLSSLYGISAGDLDSSVAKIPMMNVKATEFFLAQVKSGKLDAVKAGIAARQADLEAQWKQYLPDQLALVQNYQLVTDGDWVFFVIAEDADRAVSAFRDCTK